MLEHQLSRKPFHPGDFAASNYVDAMALISKEAWAYVGGYATFLLGWEDYDLWLRFINAGLFGIHVDEILADYRVHPNSMLKTSTDKKRNKADLNQWIESQHHWLGLVGDRVGYQIQEISDDQPNTQAQAS